MRRQAGGCDVSLELSESIPVGGERLEQDLQRDVAVRGGVLGTADVTHVSRPDPSGDLVGADSSAWVKRHHGRIVIIVGPSGG